MLTFDLKTWAAAFGLILLMSVWDVSVRLYPEQMQVEVKDSKSYEQNKSLPKIASADLAKILALYDKFDQKAVAPIATTPAQTIVKKAGLTEQEQAQQSGRLDKFYIGDQRFVLKGIFTDNRRFAVLYREDLITGKRDELRVEQQQQVGDYRVTQISERQVLFSLNDRVVELSIF